MTGLENITGCILNDAEAEVKKTTAEAAEKAALVKADYEKKILALGDEYLTKGRIAADDRKKSVISAAEMETGKQLLSTKQELLDKAFQLALEKLTAMPEDGQVGLIAKLAAEASTDGTGTMILNAADRAAFGEKALEKANSILSAAGKNAQLKLADETRDIPGGLILSSGSIEVNCAYDTLVRLKRGEITGEVAKFLFA